MVHSRQAPILERPTVAAVITAFHPDRVLDVLLDRLTPQVHRTVVVDNTPGGSPRVDDPRVTYVRTGANVGLAAALNRGVEQALETPGVTHISFWDQDSVPPADYIEAALERARPVRGAPDVIVNGVHGPGSTRADAPTTVETIRLITSGLIVPVGLVRRIGHFREDFFVDVVDTDYSLRARALGARLYECRDLVITHRFGDPTRGRRLLGVFSRTSGHPPWRQYWIVRNTLILIGEYWRTDSPAAFNLAHRLAHWLVRLIVAGPQRIQVVVAAAYGVAGAISGRTHDRYDRRAPHERNTTAVSMSNEPPTPYGLDDRSEVVPFIPSSASTVLDVGCGSGAFGATLRRTRPQLEVVGLEPDTDSAAAASGSYHRIIHGEFPTDVPADTTWDVIVFNDVLEHLVDPWQALRSAQRYLSPDGVVVASIPSIRFAPVLWDLVVRGRWDYADRGTLDRTHLRFFTKHSIGTLFEDAGFVVRRIEGVHAVSGRRWRWVRRLPGHLSETQWLQFVVAASPRTRSAVRPSEDRVR